MVAYAKALLRLFLQRTEGAKGPRYHQDLVEQAIGAAKEKQPWLLAAESVNLGISVHEVRT